MPISIRYVGDPFVDAGVATLEHRIGKACQEFEVVELQQQADWLKEQYSRKIWTGYLTVHFPNSGWCNATMSTSNRSNYIASVLGRFDRPTNGRACGYCGREAQDLADRSNIPLLTGAASMSAGPGGIPGFPVCASCLFAVQFYPLATLKVEGRPLFWWSADHVWQYSLTEEFFYESERITATASDSMPSLKWPSTRLLVKALEVFERVEKMNEGVVLSDVVGCHATNYGSGPDYSELRLPRSMFEFWREGRAFPALKRIVESNWDKKVKGAGKPSKEIPDEVSSRSVRNYFYEDLASFLKYGTDDRDALRRFGGKYFFRPKSVEPGSFDLARVFLLRMTSMTKSRLEAIERLGYQIADANDYKAHVDKLFRARNVIGALVNISDRMMREKKKPLQCADIYQAFDIVSDDDATIRDAWLVRDLILLRILESKGEPALPDEEQEADRDLLINQCL